MKRILLVFIAIISLYSAKAQIVDRAIGVRLGNGYGSTIEFSYQHPLTVKNRLELDASTSFGTNWASIGATGLIHWVFKIENGFQWFVGGGASIGNTFTSYDYDTWNNGRRQTVTNRDSYFTVALTPNGGAEYWFKNIPLQLAVDTRPYINLLNVNENNLKTIDFTIGVAARYRFK